MEKRRKTILCKPFYTEIPIAGSLNATKASTQIDRAGVLIKYTSLHIYRVVFFTGRP